MGLRLKEITKEDIDQTIEEFLQKVLTELPSTWKQYLLSPKGISLFKELQDFNWGEIDWAPTDFEKEVINELENGHETYFEKKGR